MANRHVTLFFFFQAEDGIRDLTVTGVQTCALPISTVSLPQGSTVTAVLRYYRSTYQLLLSVSARCTRPHHGLLPAARGRHSACPDLHKKLAQCFTLPEPGHNSSAASHIVRTPSGRKHCRPASAWTAKVSNLACGCPAAPVPSGLGGGTRTSGQASEGHRTMTTGLHPGGTPQDPP